VREFAADLSRIGITCLILGRPARFLLHISLAIAALGFELARITGHIRTKTKL